MVWRCAKSLQANGLELMKEDRDVKLSASFEAELAAILSKRKKPVSDLERSLYPSIAVVMWAYCAEM